MTDKELLMQEAFLLDVSEEIERVMQEKRVSKADLAIRLCSSKPNVTQLLNGARNMSLRTLAKVCFHLGEKPHFELKRRIEQPSEREKALVTVARFIRDDCSHHSNDTDMNYAAMLTEALAAYEKEDVK